MVGALLDRSIGGRSQRLLHRKLCPKWTQVTHAGTLFFRLWVPPSDSQVSFIPNTWRNVSCIQLSTEQQTILYHSRVVTESSACSLSARFKVSRIVSCSSFHLGRGTLHKGPIVLKEISPIRAIGLYLRGSTVFTTPPTFSEYRSTITSLRTCTILTKPRIRVPPCFPVSG